MTESNNISNLRAFEDEATFRRIILMKSWENEIVDLINNHLWENNSCGRELSDYNSNNVRTFEGVPLIHDSDNTSSYSTVIYGNGVKREHLSDYISFKGEIPVATEIISKDYKILIHEIALGEINLERIIDKYEESWGLLGWVFAKPMQEDEFPVIIWGWRNEIRTALDLLSWKEAKLIEIGRIKLVPLEMLMDAAPEYFEMVEADKASSIFL